MPVCLLTGPFISRWTTKKNGTKPRVRPISPVELIPSAQRNIVRSIFEDFLWLPASILEAKWPNIKQILFCLRPANASQSSIRQPGKWEPYMTVWHSRRGRTDWPSRPTLPGKVFGRQLVTAAGRELFQCGVNLGQLPYGKQKEKRKQIGILKWMDEPMDGWN